jgi:single-strand DNA-binding protein
LEPKSGGNTSDRGGNYGGGQEGSSYGQGQRNQNQNQGQRNQEYTRVDEDPFANNGEPIDISDDDLPF